MSAMTYDNPTILDHYKVRVLRFEHPGAVDSGQRTSRKKRFAQIGGAVAGLGLTAAAIANRGRIARGAGKLIEGAKGLLKRGGKRVARVNESKAPAPSAPKATVSPAAHRSTRVRPPAPAVSKAAPVQPTPTHVASPVTMPGTHSVPKMGTAAHAPGAPPASPIKPMSRVERRRAARGRAEAHGEDVSIPRTRAGRVAQARKLRGRVNARRAERANPQGVSEPHLASNQLKNVTVTPKYSPTFVPWGKRPGIVAELNAKVTSEGKVIKYPKYKTKMNVGSQVAYPSHNQPRYDIDNLPGPTMANPRAKRRLTGQPKEVNHLAQDNANPSPSYATMKRGKGGKGKYKYSKAHDIKGDPIPVPEEWKRARTMLVKNPQGRMVKVKVPGVYKADMIPAESVYPAATNRGQKVRRMFVRGTGRGARLKQRIGGKGKSSTGRPARMGGRDWGFYGSEAKKTAKMQNFLNQQANMAAAGKPNALFNKKIGLHPDQGAKPTHAFIQVGGKKLNYARTLKVNTGRGETAHIHTWADPKTGHEYFQTMQGKIRNLTGPMKNAHDAQVAKAAQQTGERVKRHRLAKKMVKESAQSSDYRAKGILERTPEGKKKGGEKWNVIGQSMDPSAKAKQGELTEFTKRQLKRSDKKLNRQPGEAKTKKKKVVRELPPDTVAPRTPKAKPEVGEGGIPVAHFKPGAQPVKVSQSILDDIKRRKMSERVRAINSFRFTERLRRVA